MERNTNVITCPLPEDLREQFGITEDTFFDARYDDGKLYIRVVDEQELENVDLDKATDEAEDSWEGSYALGRLAGQLEGYKEGYSEGYQDGFEDKPEKPCCGNCHESKGSGDAEG